MSNRTQILDLTTADYAVHEDPDVENPFVQEEENAKVRERDFPASHVRDLEASLETQPLFRKALHGQFKGVDLSSGPLDKKRLIQGLSAQIPLNEVDLPLYFYRPDMLDEKLMEKVLREHTEGNGSVEAFREITGMLDASGIPLTFTQGFPTLPNGKPFWEQFEFETLDSYQMFVAYLELDGLRKLSDLASMYPLMLMQEYYHTHYWIFRARAFDLYRVANASRQRLNRMLGTEDRHYRLAEKAMKTLEKYIDSISDIEGDAWVNMSPDKAIAMMEKLALLQRVSVGLPKSGESKERDEARVVTSPQQLIAANAGSSNRETSAVDDAFEDLLDDPEAAAMAQDLILRRQASGKMD